MRKDLLQKIGTVYQQDNFIIFFGGKSATLEQLTEICELPLSVLKQEHKCRLVKASSGFEVQIADAQWTADNSIIPLIKTADCLPVMITDPISDRSLAIHAGWRGVEQEIVAKSIRQMNYQDLKAIKIFIGPHIQQDSFEVDEDVAKSILKALGTDYYTKNKNKYYINLAKIVLKQLEASGVSAEQVNISPIDTVKDVNYFSYRRKDMGRNYSFCLKVN